MARVKLHVTPNARTAGVVVQGEVIHVRVNAPPTEGKANRRLTEILAQALEVPRSRVVIVGGVTSRWKTAQIVGMESGDVFTRLERLSTSKLPCV